MHVCYCVMYIGGIAVCESDPDYLRAGSQCVCVLLCISFGDRALSVSDKDYPCASSMFVCVVMYCIMGPEPLVHLTKIIQGLVADVRVCC